MSDFDYDSLHALSAVVREGTFEAAARSLNVTQSAVSQRIKHLEERLGAIVVVRGRPCAPTELGLELCHHIEQVHLLEHQLRRNIESASGQGNDRAAQIRIAVNSDSLATWFPTVVKRAARELNIHFDIIADDQEYTNERLTSGEALAAVTASEDPIQGFRRMPLGEMEYMAVASQDFARKHLADGITSEALQRAPVLLFDRKDTLPKQWLLSALGETGELKGHMIPSYDGYLECCLNSAGWGMMPVATVEKLVRSGRLIELVPKKRVRTPLHWQSSARGSELLRQLASIVSEEARKKLIWDPDRI